MAARDTFLEELSTASRHMRTLFDSVARAHGLTLARARVLRALEKADDITQTALATGLEIEGPTLVRLLDHLEEQGCIERCVAEGDRRVKRIALTGEGRRQAAQVEAIARAVRAMVLDGISDADLAIALRVLTMMTRNIEAAPRMPEVAS